MADFNGHIRCVSEIPRTYIARVTERLDAFVSTRPHYWDLHDIVKPNRFDVFEDTTQHIVFSFPVSTDSAKKARTFPVWQDWRSVIQPIIDLVTPGYGFKRGQVNRIMLAKLRRGGEIGMHIDADTSATLPHKIHVPLITNKRVEFWEGDARYHLPVGYAYEVNNQIPHGGANYGGRDRVHLIFDYVDRSRLHEERVVRV